MLSQFDPKRVESSVSSLWDVSDLHTQPIAHPVGNFSIPLPPPNITGTLHLGHAFQQTLMDILIRFHKMNGYQVHWQGGVDHAGIATQLVVSRRLRQQGLDPETLSQKEFMDYVVQWKNFSAGEMQSQMKRLGLFMDTSHNRFTMDSDYCQSVQDAFSTLYNAGLIYRGLKLVNWDPVLKTAISDLEVNMEESSSSLWIVHYAGSDQTDGKGISVATTRPETIFGDVAIAVHPEDARYSDWIGKKVVVPLCQRKIPVIADSTVDPNFGTGAVKITPAHDFFDEKMAKKHHLPYVKILNDQAQFIATPFCCNVMGEPIASKNYCIPKQIVGCSVIKGRAIVERLLSETGAIIDKKDHTSPLPIADRTGAVVEPYLTWQWFLKTDNLAEAAKRAVAENVIAFFPKKYKNLYFSWMNNIQDWCISRQLICGHAIPIWFDAEERAYLGRSDEEIRKKYHLPDEVPLRPCGDVLDTWFASALWTFAALERSNDPTSMQRLQDFHPYSVLITGFDIIFFWVARMIMLSLELKKEIPFKNVLFTGLVRDESGKKMSKSRGNVLDPIDMIDGISLEALLKKRTAHFLTGEVSSKQSEIIAQTRHSFPQGIEAHGSDALRFTFAALATQGRDLYWDMQRLAGYKNFCNKLWNATKFVRDQLQNFSEQYQQQASLECHPQLEACILHQWMRRSQQRFLKEYTEAIRLYRFDLAAQIIYDFFWHTFCDKFLEMAKSAASSGDKEHAEQSCVSLWIHLEELLRALHPIMPMITEYLWQILKNSAPIGITLVSCIILSPFPPVYEESLNGILSTGENAINWLQEFIFEIRKFRREHRLPQLQPLKIGIKSAPFLELHWDALQRFSKNLLKNCEWDRVQDADISLKNQQMIKIGSVEVYLTITEEMLARAQAENTRMLEALKSQRSRLEARLSHEVFLKKAPEKLISALKKDLESISLKIQLLQSPS